MAITPAEYNRRMQAAVREHNRKVQQHNRRVASAINDHNRKVDQHNKQVVADYNRGVDQHNRQVRGARQKAQQLNSELAAASRPTVHVRWTPDEEALVERVYQALPHETREFDLFCSYARIDGAEAANELQACLKDLGLQVWFDDAEMQLGKSNARQMDKGLMAARAGVVVLTPAYLAGRFWTERELGVLLNKETLIPVLHKVTWEDVKKYSGILPDLQGLTTKGNSIPEIALKIAAAVSVDD